MILLTGSTGFLGSHIAEALVEAGHPVRCSVRSTSDTRWIDSLGADIVELDLAASSQDLNPNARLEHEGDQARVKRPEALKDIEIVIHCGGLTRARDEAEFMRVNAGGTARLAKASAAAGVTRFIYISSLAARGPDGVGEPMSPYGRSKRAGEQGLEDNKGDMGTTVLRPGGIYGARDSALLPMFEMAARGWVVVPRSEVPLQPIYVSDVGTATLAAIEEPSTGAPVEVAGARQYRWEDVAHALGAAVGDRARVLRVPSGFFWTAGLVSELWVRVVGGLPAMDRRKAWDICHHSWTCDIEEAGRALGGWKPRVEIDEGMLRTAAWYREAGWL